MTNSTSPTTPTKPDRTSSAALKDPNVPRPKNHKPRDHYIDMILVLDKDGKTEIK